MHTKSPGARPQAGVFQILSDPGVKALWKTLTSDQKALLLAAHDRIGDVTFTEVARARRILPEGSAPLPPVARAPFRNFAPVNDHTREQVCPACNGEGVKHTCFPFLDGKAVR